MVTCRARGRLRQDEIKPLVGDRVLCQVAPDNSGVITEILERRNYLDRPLVANVDQLLVMCAVRNPIPNLGLIDRLLVIAEFSGLEAMVGINKADLGRDDRGLYLRELYADIGYPSYLFSLEPVPQGLDGLQKLLADRVTVLAGQSGVGKSSFLNVMVERQVAEVGFISQRGGAGRHTTRHVELLSLPAPTRGFLVDTPGFSRLQLPPDLASASLKDGFLEFNKFRDCRFGNRCLHLEEPDCHIKRAVAAGKIAQSRYDSYRLLYDELWHQERRY